jgi:hypothetical protein
MLRIASSPPFLGRGWGWGKMTEETTISRDRYFGLFGVDSRIEQLNFEF